MRFLPACLFGLAATALTGLLLGGRLGATLVAISCGLLPAALMALGIGGGARRRRLRLVAAGLGVWISGCLLALVALAGGNSAPRLWGLPLPAAVAVYGLWLLPLLPAALAFGLGFRRFLPPRRPAARRHGDETPP